MELQNPGSPHYHPLRSTHHSAPITFPQSPFQPRERQAPCESRPNFSPLSNSNLTAPPKSISSHRTEMFASALSHVLGKPWIAASRVFGSNTSVLTLLSGYMMQPPLARVVPPSAPGSSCVPRGPRHGVQQQAGPSSSKAPLSSTACPGFLPLPIFPECRFAVSLTSSS